MSLVTGTLNDCNLGHLADSAPELIFTLSGAATAGDDLTEKEN